MALVVKVGEAKTRLSELLHRVEAGEDVILSRGPVAVARLAPIEPGGRREAAVLDLLEARDSGASAPATAAELGLWRRLSRAGDATRGAAAAASRRAASAEDGPEAPPGAQEIVGAPDLSRGFVVESSFAAAWALPGPDRRAADAAAGALARGPAKMQALAPPDFWTGFADLLVAARRRDRLDDGPAATLLTRAGRLPIAELSLQDGLDLETETEARAAILRLAMAQDLCFADAACLAFARARGLALATNLADLARVAARFGVPVLTDLADVDLA